MKRRSSRVVEGYSMEGKVMRWKRRNGNGIGMARVEFGVHEFLDAPLIVKIILVLISSKN